MNDIDEQFEDALHREARARTEHLQLPEPEPLAADAPAPRLEALVADYGPEPCARALAAWEARLRSIIDVAHGLGLSINAAKVLLKQVHEAVAEDLKENLEQNRSLDLARIDALLNAHYPKAKAGKVKSSQLVLRCLERRAKLIGIEPLPAPTTNHQTNVLVWLREKMPNINSLVDSLPTELPPPAAPT
jgi:hypothetical protein